MGENEQAHTPVMLREVIDLLQPEGKSIVVDATLGMGGHAAAILSRMSVDGKLIGFDRDAGSMEEARKNLSAFGNRCQLVHQNYRNISNALRQLGIESIDGIVMDFGISSYQLDDPMRGFSLRHDGPLDMRMDVSQGPTAAELLRKLSEKEIAVILRDYGEERFHHRIARNIVRERAQRRIETTAQLSAIILRSMPHGRQREKIHPATRTFQALRIAVNKELEAIESALSQAITVLKPGGRIVVISFHSLEDRIVKEVFRSSVKAGQLNLLTKKPLRPTESEVESNPRSRSARLRAAERI